MNPQHLHHSRVHIVDELTETRVRVLCLDAFSPVLAEEHVGGQGALRRILILFCLGLRSLCFALGGSTLYRAHRRHDNTCGRTVGGQRMHIWAKSGLYAYSGSLRCLLGHLHSIRHVSKTLWTTEREDGAMRDVERARAGARVDASRRVSRLRPYIPSSLPAAVVADGEQWMGI